MSLYGFVCWVEWETFASNGCLYSQISTERESYRWTDKGSSNIKHFPRVVQVWGVEVTGAKYTVMLRKRKAWCYSGRGGQVGSLEAQWIRCMGSYWLPTSCGRASVHSLMDWGSRLPLLWQTQRGVESKQSPASQHKEQLLGYRLDIRKNSFSERVVRLPREMVGSSVLEVFEECVHVVLKEVA